MSDYSLDAPSELMHLLADVMFDQLAMGYTTMSPAMFADAAASLTTILDLEEIPELDRFTQVVIHSLYLAGSKYSRHINLPNKPSQS